MSGFLLSFDANNNNGKKVVPVVLQEMFTYFTKMWTHLTGSPFSYNTVLVQWNRFLKLFTKIYTIQTRDKSILLLISITITDITTNTFSSTKLFKRTCFHTTAVANFSCVQLLFAT